MRTSLRTPYLHLPQIGSGTLCASGPLADSTSGTFTFKRLRGAVAAPALPLPPRADRRLLNSPTAYSAAAFAVAFVVYLTTGCACLTVFDSYPPHGELETLEQTKCLTAYRHAHHSEVRLYLGTPPRAVRLLVRTDISKACTLCDGASNVSNTSDTFGASIVIVKSDVLHSTSLVCDIGRTACVDVAIVSRWRGVTPRNELRSLRFLYGAQHLAGLEASQLGLDGEIVFCHGVSYALTVRQLCAAPAAALDAPAQCAGLAVQMVAQTTLDGVGALGSFGTSACDLRQAGGLWSETPAAHARCADCNATVELFPAGASVSAAWLTFASSHMFDTVGSSSVGAMRVAVEAGNQCAAHTDQAVVVARKRFDIACAAGAATSTLEGTACGRSPSVAPMRASGYRLGVTVYANGNACFVASSDPSLHANAASGPYGQPAGSPTSGEAWLRLLLMVFAAAIVWVRRDDAIESADHIFVRCVQIAVEGASHTIVDIDAQTRALGLIAAVARLTLAATTASNMIADGQVRVVATECVAALLSMVHWFALHGGWCFTSVRSLKDAGLRPALGGSAAIVDITCATMMAFATTPVRGDVDSFDVIARLLTAVLLSVACVSRCLLSAACSGALTQCRFQADALCSANALALCAAVFWWFQAASIAVVMADLFAAPISLQWARESTGDASLIAVLLFATASLISAPRLTANAVAITAGVHEAEQRIGLTEENWKGT